MRLREWAAFLWADRIIRVMLLAAGALNLAAWALVVVRLWPLIAANRIISLHYSIYLGVNDIGRAPWVLLVPLVGTAALLVNAAFAGATYRTDRNSAVTLVAITACFEAIVLAASVSNVLINLAV